MSQFCVCHVVEKKTKFEIDHVAHCLEVDTENTCFIVLLSLQLSVNISQMEDNVRVTRIAICEIIRCQNVLAYSWAPEVNTLLTPEVNMASYQLSNWLLESTKCFKKMFCEMCALKVADSGGHLKKVDIL